MDYLQIIKSVSELRNTVGQNEGESIMLLGYYESGDKDPLIYKWTTAQGVDDGGSIINATGGSWKIQSNIINALDFGLKQNNTEIVNNAVIQNAINFSVVRNINKMLLPKWYKFSSEKFNIPNNIAIEYFGNTYERKLFLNNINPNGTPVNEWEISSPFHTGLIIGNDDSIVPQLPESHTKRAASIVFRRNGFSALQNICSSLGLKWHWVEYVGIARIQIQGNAQSSGNININLRGEVFNIPINNGDTENIILQKVLNYDYGSFWSRKTLSSNIVHLYPRKETIINVREINRTGLIYTVSIDNVNYNIPILLSDSTREIATKIAESTLIPSDKYVLYNEGSTVVCYHKEGEISIEKPTSIVATTDVTGISLTTSVIPYQGKYNRLLISPTGNVGIGLWSAKDYQLEVANNLRVLANTDESDASAAYPMVILENEKLKQVKSFKINQTTGDLEVLANDRLTVLASISETGDIQSKRDMRVLNVLRFKKSNRFITTNSFNNEDAFYISNNAGNTYTARISDANGIELNKNGEYRKVQPIYSGATAQRPTDAITGFQFFDTSINKPIWYNGTGWVDANGNIIP